MNPKDELSILDPPEPEGLRQKKTGRAPGLRWIVPVLILLTLATAAVLLWPKEPVPPAETTEPAPAWETNYLIAGEQILLEGSTVEEHIENAAKHMVPGSRITRDQIRSVTFLDTLQEIPSSAWDVSAVGNGSVMAWTKLNDGLYDLYIAAEGGVNAGGACTSLFAGYKNMESVHFGTSFHTDEATSLSKMFMGCRSLKELDLSCLETGKVTDYALLFYGCMGLEKLNIESLDTASATSFYAMFAFCSGLEELDLRHFRTANVTNMASMFRDCKALQRLKWDAELFDTSSVNQMHYMFAACEKLEELPVGTFGMDQVTTTAAMFYGCSALKELDISSWNTSEVTDMESMFRGCTKLTELKLGQMDTGNVTNMYAMFWDTPCVTVEDVSFFNTEKVEKYDFFLNGTGWESLFE